VLANPPSLSSDARSRSTSCSGPSLRQAANLVRLLLRRAGSRTCRASPPSSAVSTTASGHHPRHRHVRAELTQDEIRELTARLEQSTGGRIALDVEVDPACWAVSSYESVTA
jgi:hypothetical protein